MNFSFFIAKRYLISKKSTNIINIISFVSLIGVAFGTTAFIIVLSVFNGLENLVRSLFNSFDPDIRIELVEGKSFNCDSTVFDNLDKLDYIAYSSYVIEESALLEYDSKQLLGIIKGVDENYKNVTGVDTMIYEGSFVLLENPAYYCVIGYGIAAKLGITLDLGMPLKIWAPVRNEGINVDARTAFNSDIIPISSIFSVQQEYDSKYVIVPIEFARELMNYENRATALELKLVKDVNLKNAQKEIKQILGDGFEVKNRFEQKQLAYKIMKTEKWAIIAILSFILIVSSFNIIGTMIMLIIEKKNDINTLNAIGADLDKIRKIFLYEGWLISVIGAIIGLILGTGVSLGQQIFGWIKFPSDGSFVQNVYPVRVHGIDVIFVFVVVVLIGYLVAKFPVRFITRKFFTVN